MLDEDDEATKNSTFDKGLVFRRLVFGLAFFHAIVQERRLYGPLGWNIPYEFNESDLKISLQQLSMFLRENDKVPFKALCYTVGECNYGGRVTDDKDRICLNTILDLFYADSFLVEGANITPSGSFKVPKDGSISDFVSFIEAMPVVAPPEVFGLDDNATLTKDQNETTAMFKTILLTQGGGSGGGGGGGNEKDNAVDNVANDVLSKLPKPFDMEEAEVKYPVLFEESMNTVLCQELVKYNRLINVISSSLKSVRKAIKGLVVMSSALEQLSNQLFFGLIPDMWLKKSYGSLKPLAGYFADLLQRIEFFTEWLKTSPPTVFWLSGFFFTHAFTTGAKQNFARKYTIPIDNVDFEQEMMPRPETSYTKKPKDGVYTYGLFFEGCRWNKKSVTLDERLPKVLFSPAPVMWFIPMKVPDIPVRSHYNCPVYKTSDRRGILATTGHSTNFVCFIRVPIEDTDTQAHWVLRGAALLTQLDD
jgi:dynein heavy chain